MSQSYGGCESLPITISQLQRLAKTFQETKQFDSAGLPAIARQAPPLVVRSSAEPMVFTDRRGAGSLLAERLAAYVDRRDVLVVGLPQGGIPVAAEVARQLGAPLAVWVAKRLRAHIPFAGSIGAVAEDGELLVDEEAFQKFRVPPSFLMDEVRACRGEVKRRAIAYRASSLPPSFRDRTVIVVDEGAVSGHTMRAALVGLKRQRPRELVVALPVAPVTLARRLGTEVNELVVLETTFTPSEVGQYFVHFPSVETSDNLRLLQRHHALAGLAQPAYQVN